jgi:predicted transposase/invertase (TIGR01784 family)
MKNIYDISIKDTISGLEGAFTELFLEFKIKTASKPLNLELIKIEEKKADFICKIIDLEDKESILHIEFQTSNHTYMHFRMLRYVTELYKIHKLPIIQLVIYLGKNKMNMKNTIKFNTKYTKIDYEYKLVNISELSCDKFIKSNNADLIVLSILCDFKNKDKHLMIREIYQRLEKICKNDTNEFKNKLYKLEIFSKLRDLEDILKEEETMLTDVIDMRDLPSYSFGLDRGIEQGKKKEKIEIAKNLLDILDIGIIALKTGLTEKEIEKLVKK